MLIHHDVRDLIELHQNPLAEGMLRVFNWYYPCRLKQMYLYSEEEIGNVGLATTLDPNYDYEFANVLVDAQITVSDMAELYSEGISFQFEKLEDMEKVYENIRNYLSIAADALNERNITPEVAKTNPQVINFIKDIQKFEDLGNALYPRFLDKKDTKVTNGFGTIRLRNSLRRGQIREEKRLTEEQKRMQQRFHLDIRKELIPYVKDSTSVWFRRREA